MLCVMPAWTFVASAHAAVSAGLVPYFVDVDPRTFQIDPAHLEARIADVRRYCSAKTRSPSCGRKSPGRSLAARPSRLTRRRFETSRACVVLCHCPMRWPSSPTAGGRRKTRSTECSSSPEESRMRKIGILGVGAIGSVIARALGFRQISRLSLILIATACIDHSSEHPSHPPANRRNSPAGRRPEPPALPSPSLVCGRHLPAAQTAQSKSGYPPVRSVRMNSTRICTILVSFLGLTNSGRQ